MINDIYNLPTYSFVGGESQTFTFNLRTKANLSYDAESCSMSFALINYSTKTGSPVLTKNFLLSTDSNGSKSIATVTLDPMDTVDLYGSYVYQITIWDMSCDKTEIPGQGIMKITRNIHKDYIKNPPKEEA